MKQTYIHEAEREIPLIKDVDIVICGATIAAVSAACEIRKKGKSVCLVAPRLFLGEDLCSTLKLWLDDDEAGDTPIAKALFEGKRYTTPCQVKKALESICLDKQIDFILGATVTELLHDETSRLAGVVIADRSGRQAIKAKCIIDASTLATATRLTVAKFAKPSGTVTFKRVILSGEVDGLEAVNSGQIINAKPVYYYIYELEATAPESIIDYAEMEQAIRDISYQEKQLRSAESVYFDRVGTVECCNDMLQWKGYDQLDIGSFAPVGIEKFFLLNSFAAISDEDVSQLHKLSIKEAVGAFVGSHAVSAVNEGMKPSKTVAAVTTVEDSIYEGKDSVGIDFDGEMIDVAENSLPIVAEYDVLVIGGGTSGAAAAISAVRHGARVMVVEFQEALGGIGTIGMIGKAYHGKDIGFAEEVPFPEVKHFADDDSLSDANHSPEYKMEWLRCEIRKHGGHILQATNCCGAVVDGNTVKGAVIASAMGRLAILADVVIDATANADVAIAAGADYMYGSNADDIALQGTGLSTRPLNEGYVNSDYLLVDEADFRDIQNSMVGMRLALNDLPYDTCPMIQNREHRRIKGEHVLRYLDQIVGRTYPDSVVWSSSDYDSHGYPSDIYFALLPHDDKTKKMNHPAPGGECFTPYRCFIPRGLDGVFVIGVALSMERDASAMIRMQKDLYNQGYAIGLAAVMAHKSKCPLRQVDIKSLQQELIRKGCLPEFVLNHVDSFPFSDDRLEEAVAAYGQYYEEDIYKAREELAIILSHAERVVPFIVKAFQNGNLSAELCYAKLLGCLGRNDGVELLTKALEKETWDEKIFQGAMAEFAHLPTPVDSLIWALGYSRDPRAVSAIIDKMKYLDASSTLSHHRAVAIALSQLKSPDAAPAIAELLNKKGMSGHEMLAVEPLYDKPVEKRRREVSLRELFLAKALYLCGDYEGLAASILKAYTHDIRAIFANHAKKVLEYC